MKLMKNLNRDIQQKKILNRAQIAFLCQKIQYGFNLKKTNLAMSVDFKAASDLISFILIPQLEFFEKFEIPYANAVQ